MNRSKLCCLAAVLVTALISGCAGVATVPLEKETRSRIQTISVNETVPVPDTVFFFGMKQSLAGAAGGLVGAAVGEVAFNEKDALKEILQDNNIQVGQILRAEFTKQLEKTKIFPRVTSTGANAQFNISVNNYGLFKKGAFDGDLRAAIWGVVSLVSPDGTVLWRKRIKPEAFESRLPAYDFAYYKSNPEALRKGFEALSSIVVAELIDDLQR